MSICLVILSGIQSKNTFDLTEFFFLKIVVESYKKTGPSQCHTCQWFGHGSWNCRNSPRCVKYAGLHFTNECTKPAIRPRRAQTAIVLTLQISAVVHHSSKLLKISHQNHPRHTISHQANLSILYPYIKIIPLQLLNQYLEISPLSTSTTLTLPKTNKKFYTGIQTASNPKRMNYTRSWQKLTLISFY